MLTELLDRNLSVLVMIDFQEKLFPGVHDHEKVLARVDLLLTAANLLGVPVLATEQYPKGLGPTIAAIRTLAPTLAPLAKMDFSCAPAPGFKERLSATKRRQIILTGIETHICVAQTALDLAHEGNRVFVVADATSSRRQLDADIALRRMHQSGLTILTAESVVFEWLRRAGGEEFRALQPKVKALI